MILLKLMKKSLLSIFLALSSLLLASKLAFAESISATNTLEETVRAYSMKAVLFSSLTIIAFVALTFVFKNLSEGAKKVFFVGITLPAILTTLFLAGSTIYLNASSETGGPVHWHTDFEIYKCGERVDLVDPSGFSNKVGATTLHEHNDSRIHIEGVVINQADVSFKRFIEVAGGSLTNASLSLPTNSGLVSMQNGEQCPDGTYGELQAFLYKVDGNNIGREKLADLSSYTPSPHGSVPPGDCLIIEFEPAKTRTDKLCDSYKLQILKGKYQSGD